MFCFGELFTSVGVSMVTALAPIKQIKLSNLKTCSYNIKFMLTHLTTLEF